CAHQETPGAATLDHEPVTRRVAFLHEVLGDVDEIGERIDLVLHATLIVPRLTEVAAATDVRGAHDEPAIEQAQSVGAERDVRGRAVGADPDEQYQCMACL